MRLPLIFLFGLACGIGGALVGAYLVRNPEKVHRLVASGQAPDAVVLRRFRAIGWFYILGGTITALMFLAVTLMVLLHFR